MGGLESDESCCKPWWTYTSVVRSEVHTHRQADDLGGKIFDTSAILKMQDMLAGIMQADTWRTSVFVARQKALRVLGLRANQGELTFLQHYLYSWMGWQVTFMSVYWLYSTPAWCHWSKINLVTLNGLLDGQLWTCCNLLLQDVRFLLCDKYQCSQVIRWPLHTSLWCQYDLGIAEQT